MAPNKPEPNPNLSIVVLVYLPKIIDLYYLEAMTALDIIEKILVPLIAAFIGAVLAFRYQRRMELNRDKRGVLQVLMMYRNVGANELDWIKMLNAVDLVFGEHKRVTELYHTMLAQLKPPIYETHRWIDTYYQLMFEMAQVSGYRRLSLQDIRDYYSPEVLSRHYPNMNVASGPSAPLPDDLPQTN